MLRGVGLRLLSAPGDHGSHPLGEVFSDSLGVSLPRPQGWQHQPAEALWWPGQGLEGRNAGLGARGQQTHPGLCPGNRSCAALGSARLSEAPSHGVGQRLSSRLGQVRANVQAGCTPWALAASLCQAGGSHSFLLQAGHLEHSPLCALVEVASVQFSSVA